MDNNKGVVNSLETLVLIVAASLTVSRAEVAALADTTTTTDPRMATRAAEEAVACREIAAVTHLAGTVVAVLMAVAAEEVALAAGTTSTPVTMAAAHATIGRTVAPVNSSGAEIRALGGAAAIAGPTRTTAAGTG